MLLELRREWQQPEPASAAPSRLPLRLPTVTQKTQMKGPAGRPLAADVLRFWILSVAREHRPRSDYCRDDPQAMGRARPGPWRGVWRPG